MNTVLERLALVLSIVALVATAFGQARSGRNLVRGTVFDGESNSPLPSVTVFVQGTTRGTSSQTDGKYFLPDLADGEFDLVCSLVGYERQIFHISLRDSLQIDLNVRLKPREIKLPQVDVTASAEEWKKLLPVFTSQFLGSTQNAQQCRIINPEVVSLTIGSTGDSLRARTDSTLVVENNALGYRIYVQIDSLFVTANASWFVMECYPRFEEMATDDSMQRKEWRERRAACYVYSFTNFLSSIIHRHLRTSKYIVSSGNLQSLIRGNGDEVQEPSIGLDFDFGTGLYRISFPTHYVRVDRIYEYSAWRPPQALVGQSKSTGQGLSMNDLFRNSDKLIKSDYVSGKFPVSSIVGLRQMPIVVDRYGNLVKPLLVAFRGVWARLRLADTLPFDYQPEKEKE